MIEQIKIGRTAIAPGEEKQIDVQISRLPTRTSIEFPVIVSRAKKQGPTLLIMGGLHGDEINGIEIVRRIIVNGHHRPAAGSTICIPIVNIHGFINSSRQVPDGKDINRSFPGSPNGSLAGQTAHHLRTIILSQVDYIIDFHTGGARINNFPQIRTGISNPDNLALATAFSAKFIINASVREKSLRKEAEKMKKPILVYEGGESLRMQKNVIDEGVNGTLRVMSYLGMSNNAPQPKYSTVIIQETSWVRAKTAGLYHSFVRAGEKVEKGKVLGLITGPFGDSESPVKSTVNGYIIGTNNNPVVNKGDALLHIGTV